VREIVPRRIRREGIEVINHPALLGKTRARSRRLAQADVEQVGRERAQRRIRRQIDRPAAPAECALCHRPVPHRSTAHCRAWAVAQRSGPPQNCSPSCRDGGARCGRDIDRKPQAIGLELAVEVIEHDAGSTVQRLSPMSSSRRFVRCFEHRPPARNSPFGRCECRRRREQR